MKISLVNALRLKDGKGVSARDMSLSIGQAQINKQD
jgi:hypothetical protein